MKQKTKLQQLIDVLPLLVVITFVPACATTTGTAARSDVQSRLVQSGFKARPVTTAEQKRQLQSLPEHQFQVVKQNGENFYVWADKPNNQLYCGGEQAYRTYKQHRKAQRERESGAITWIAEPSGIPVTVFHGWAPFREW